MTEDELALRLATLVPNPTQITETVWGPRLPADSCTPRWSALFGIDPNFTTAATTEAETEAAYARWCRDHTGGTE